MPSPFWETWMLVNLLYFSIKDFNRWRKKIRNNFQIYLTKWSETSMNLIFDVFRKSVRTDTIVFLFKWNADALGKIHHYYQHKIDINTDIILICEDFFCKNTIYSLMVSSIQAILECCKIWVFSRVFSTRWISRKSRESFSLFKDFSIKTYKTEICTWKIMNEAMHPTTELDTKIQ